MSFTLRYNVKVATDHHDVLFCLVDCCGVHPHYRELWRPAPVRQQPGADLLPVRVLHDRHHVHCWLRGHLPRHVHRKVVNSYCPNNKCFFRMFQIVFLVVGLAMFSTFIPEALMLLGGRRKFGGVYKNERCKTFIIVSGHVTFETVQSFLSDFHHEDREDEDIEAVFLHPDEPELEFEGFLKKKYPKVRYFQGSLMESVDLERLQVERLMHRCIITKVQCKIRRRMLMRL